MAPDINTLVVDAIISRPNNFTIGGKQYALHPLTLGQTLLMERLLSALGINRATLAAAHEIEALRLATVKAREVNAIIALATCRDKEECLNEQLRKTRARFFSRTLNESERAELLIAILSAPVAEQIIDAVGLSSEASEQATIARYKNRDGGTLAYGGKTLYGTLIDAAASRFGWTLDYIVWGIPLISLRMMLADASSSINVSEDERRVLCLYSGDDYIDGETADIDTLRQITNN